VVGKHRGMFVDRREHVIWDGSLDSLSELQLLRLEEQMIQIACSEDPTKMAELRSLRLVRLSSMPSQRRLKRNQPSARAGF
jgi:hypothetical protein